MSWWEGLQEPTVLLFVLHGLLGGLLYLLLKWKWSKRAVVQRLGVGAIAGYIYYLLYSEYSFPNSLMSIVFGYFGVDVLESLFKKLMESRHVSR